MTKTSYAAAALLAAVAVAGCSSTSQVVDAANPGAASSPSTASSQDALIDPDSKLPGLPALIGRGCERTQVDSEEGEWSGWVPIHSVVNQSGRAISGTVIDISIPRISSKNVNPDGGTMDVTYFRILTVKADGDSFALTQPAPVAGEELQVMLIGAGVDTDSSTLCYGGDGHQDSRELPLAVGDQVIVLATAIEEARMTNPPPELQFLQYGMAGLWKVQPDGLAVSAIPGFDLDAKTLLERFRIELARADTPVEDLPPEDTLARPPEPEIVVPTTVRPPPPPDPDSSDTPTIPTPDGHGEEDGD